MSGNFTHREVRALGGKRLHRLGLSPSFGLDEAGCAEALEQVQYVFWNPLARKFTAPLREACRRDRERYVIAGGPTLAYLPGQLRRYVDRARKLLGTDYLDVLQLFLIWRKRMRGAFRCGPARSSDMRLEYDMQGRRGPEIRTGSNIWGGEDAELGLPGLG